ncbi:MAG: hypothetical protein HJJLKODD_00987 [Phycisphaerae bacterium]|nr:hypothetical protein [Phycisphaerae bacterium]
MKATIPQPINTEQPMRSAAYRWLQLAVIGLAAAVLLAAVFGPLTFRLAGWPGIRAMTAALLAVWIAQSVGSIPICQALTGAGPVMPNKVMGSMILRLISTVVVAIPLVSSGWWLMTPLLLWLAGSYFILLMVETAVLTRWIRRQAANCKLTGASEK